MKASIIPIIQMLDKKVRYYRGGLPYCFDYLDNLPYVALEAVRDRLVKEYNARLAEEDRANGEVVRLNGLLGEFQRVKKDDALTILGELIEQAQESFDHWDKDSPLLTMGPKTAEEVKGGASWSRHLKEARIKLYSLKLAGTLVRKEEN